MMMQKCKQPSEYQKAALERYCKKQEEDMVRTMVSGNEATKSRQRVPTHNDIIDGGSLAQSVEVRVETEER